MIPRADFIQRSGGMRRKVSEEDTVYDGFDLRLTHCAIAMSAVCRMHVASDFHHGVSRRKSDARIFVMFSKPLWSN